MKATQLSALIVVFLSLSILVISSCLPTPRSLPRINKFPVCDGRGSTNISRIDRKTFAKTSSKSCVKSLDPFDISTWVEAPITAFTQRNLQKVVLGCANLVPDAADCQYSGLLGHAAVLHSSFDFGRYPALARVQKAVFAFYAEDNAAFIAKAAQVRGKLNDGDVYQNLGASRITPPFKRSPHKGWVVVDVTDFAARAISEQRNDASIDLSLPCGRTEQDLATVSVLSKQPVLIVEYR